MSAGASRSMQLASALPSAIVLFGIMVAHTLLETARDALFLVRLGPDRLAWAYLAIAVTALGAVAAMRRWAGTCNQRGVLSGLLGLATAGTAVLGVLLPFAPSIVFVLYVWTGLVATLVVPTFWTVVDRRLGVGDARRQFSAIAAGGVLGALLGSAIASGLGYLLGPSVLVWVAAGVLGVTSLAAIVLAPREVHRPIASKPARNQLRTQRARRYLRVLLIAGLLSTVTLTLADLMFKRLLAEELSPEHLAAGFGAIYAGLNVIGLVVQLAVTPKLFDRLGVGATLTILPVIVIASALGFVLTGAVIAIVVLKLADGGIRHSIYRVAHEILFLPVPHALRDAAKPVLEAVGTRGGQAIAALIAFGLASTAEPSWWLAIATVGFGGTWMIAIGITRTHYVQQFRDTLEAGDIQRDVSVPTLDGSAISMLTAALSSPDEAEARAALDLLARRGDRVPALVLYHPSTAIVKRALSLLEGELRPDVERVVRHLTAHPDPEIRAAALAAASRTCTSCDLLSPALVDPEPDVRAAAVVGTMAAGGAVPEVLATLTSTSDGRAALARAIARDPRPQFRPVLDELLARRETDVTKEVLRVWLRAPELADAARLILLLEDPRVRGEARRVISADRGRYFEPLLAALEDPRTPLGVRRHLPRTISRFAEPAAATALVSRLVREPDGTTEFKILRALGRMRAERPALPVDDEIMLTYVRRSIRDAERYAHLAQAVGPAGEHEAGLELLRELLAEKRRHAIERVFRALGVLHPRADLRSVHDAITSDDRDRRAAAREVLEGLLPSTVRIPLLTALAPSSGQRPFAAPGDLFAELLVDPSDAVRCIAAHLVAERRLVALRLELERLRPYASSLVSRAFDQAIERLDA